MSDVRMAAMLAAATAAAITHYSLRFNKFTFPVYAKHNNNEKNDERNNLQLFIVIFMHHWVRAHCTIVCASLFSWFYIAECLTLFWCCNLLNWRVFVIWFVFMREAVQTAKSTQCTIHLNSSIEASTHTHTHTKLTRQMLWWNILPANHIANSSN